MTTNRQTGAVSAEVIAGAIVAAVEIAASPERVFSALTSPEIVNWWVNPGVFDTREWSGEVRVGGRWRASGIARGAPYVLEGEYLEVSPPRRLVHTWHLIGREGKPSIVTYELARTAAGTHLTVQHTGILSADVNKATAIGWEMSLRALERALAAAGA
jgi:uncharacterized protein YndB with AHSA1/START domain